MFEGFTGHGTRIQGVELGHLGVGERETESTRVLVDPFTMGGLCQHHEVVL